MSTSARKGRTTAPPAGLAALIASGKSFASIAKDLGCDANAVARWAKSAKITAEVEKIKREATQNVIAKLDRAVALASDALVRVISSGRCDKCGRASADDNAIIRASTFIIDRMVAPRPKRETVTVPASDLEEAEAVYRDVVLSLDANQSNAAATAALTRRRAEAWEALKSARAAAAKKSGGFEAAMAAIVDQARVLPLGVVDQMISRLVAVREERAPTATR